MSTPSTAFPEDAEFSQPETVSRDLIVKVAAVLVLVAIAVGLCMKAEDLNSASEPGVVMALPDSVDGFYGTEEKKSEAEKKLLPEDTVILRKRYENAAGDQITCSIVLSGGEKRSIHRPEICLPSQGWTIGSGEKIPIPLKSGKKMEVMDLSLTRPYEIRPNVFRPLQSQFLYWFVGKDRTTADHKVRILETSWDRVFKKINHRWAYVSVSAPVLEGYKPGGKDVAATQAMMRKFISDIVPYFQKSEMPPTAAK